MSWAPALLLPLVWGLLCPAGPPEGWRWGRELGWALACGLGLALLNGAWLAPFYMPGVTWTSSDFHEYCSSVAALAWGPFDAFTRQRSAAAALPAALLARQVGLVDGLGWAALGSTAALGAGLYLWGRALGGVAGGLCAALCGAALAPLVVLSRTLSLYDEMAAAFALGGAGAALALRYRGVWALAAGGAGVGLCLLADFRGLFWAVSFFGLCGVAVLWPRPYGLRERPPQGRARWVRWGVDTGVKALALYLPLWASWEAGRWAYRFNISLEEVMAPRQRLVERGFTQPELTTPFHADSAFIWGRTDPRGVPDTLLWVVQESRVIPRESWDNPEVLRVVEAQVSPWLGVWGVALALAALLCLGRRERLARLAALLGTGVPFVMGLKGAVEMQRAQLHYQGTALPWMALVMGLGWVALVEAGRLPGLRRLPAALGARWPAWARWGPRLRPLGAAVLLLVLLLGGVPSPLSPTSPWRQPWSVPDAEVRALLSQSYGPRPPDPGLQRGACLEALAQQEVLGFVRHGKLFGGVRR